MNSNRKLSSAIFSSTVPAKMLPETLFPFRLPKSSPSEKPTCPASSSQIISNKPKCLSFFKSRINRSSLFLLATKSSRTKSSLLISEHTAELRLKHQFEFSYSRFSASSSFLGKMKGVIQLRILRKQLIRMKNWPKSSKLCATQPSSSMERRCRTLFKLL